MLTTITTILGLIPMALQLNMNFFERTIAYGGITSVWWVQLSTAIISGLAFSTLLTLIVIPSMLAMPANIMAIFYWGTGRKPRQVSLEAGAAAVLVEEPAQLNDLNTMMKSALSSRSKIKTEPMDLTPKPANDHNYDDGSYSDAAE